MKKCLKGWLDPKRFDLMLIFSAGIESVFVVTDDGIEVVHRTIEQTITQEQDNRS